MPNGSSSWRLQRRKKSKEIEKQRNIYFFLDGWDRAPKRKRNIAELNDVSGQGNAIQKDNNAPEFSILFAANC